MFQVGLQQLTTIGTNKIVINVICWDTFRSAMVAGTKGGIGDGDLLDAPMFGRGDIRKDHGISTIDGSQGDGRCSKADHRGILDRSIIFRKRVALAGSNDLNGANGITFIRLDGQRVFVVKSQRFTNVIVGNAISATAGIRGEGNMIHNKILVVFDAVFQG